MCVICGGDVRDGRSTRSDGVAFDCPKHGVYAIAHSALQRFLKLDVAHQEAALLSAKLFVANRNNEVIITAMDL